MLLTALLANIQAYSQITTLNSKGDTLICFSTEQSRFLLKAYYKSKECAEIDSINKVQLSVCDSTIKSSGIIIESLETILTNKDSIIVLKDAQIVVKESNIKSLNKEVKKQRFLKVVCSGVAFVFGVIVGSVI